MAKSYFAILGVSVDASPEEIRSAFRRLAKEFHPDHFEGSSETFRKIKEAYAVLNDARRRKKYTALLMRQTRPNASSETGRRPAEPLIPKQRPLAGGAPTPLGSHRHSGARRGEAVEPLPGPPQQPGHRPIYRMDRRGCPTGMDQTLVVPLTRAQAAQGGSVTVTVPARAVCPLCRGSGGGVFHACGQCGGVGEIPVAAPVRIPFPPGVERDFRVEVPLERLGMQQKRLIVRFQPPLF